MPPSFYKAILASPLLVGGSETEVFVNTLQTLTGETVTFSEFSPLTKGYIVLDPEVQYGSQPEIVSFTGISSSDISFTGATRGLSAVSASVISANITYHGTGTPVIISWGAQNISDLLTYVNSLITGVAGNASASVAGVTKLSVNPISPTSPIALGQNDTLLTTPVSGNALNSSTNPIVDAKALIGEIKMYGGASAPTGWVLCDGTSYARAGTYANLFSVVSTTYGSVDGSHFNVPDFRGRVAVGAGTGTKTLTFASRASNVITVTGAASSLINEIQTGQAVTYASTGTDIGGLTSSTLYYLIRVSSTTFSLATTLANAQNNSVISLSSDGTGTRTFTIALTIHSIGDTGGNETHAMSATELLAHTHTLTNAVTSGSASFNATGSNAQISTPTTSSAGGNAAMPIMNPYLSVSYIIKY